MRRKIKLSTMLSLSALASGFVGFLVYWGVRKIESAFIAFGITFIVVVVSIATLALMIPESDNDPDQPVLR